MNANCLSVVFQLCPRTGVVGEYKGKFMADQTVLCGGSVAFIVGYILNRYRNFSRSLHTGNSPNCGWHTSCNFET